MHPAAMYPDMRHAWSMGLWLPVPTTCRSPRRNLDVLPRQLSNTLALKLTSASGTIASTLYIHSNSEGGKESARSPPPSSDTTPPASQQPHGARCVSEIPQAGTVHTRHGQVTYCGKYP